MAKSRNQKGKLLYLAEIFHRAPVVRVTYSIIPMFETGDTQTATAGGVSSNR